MTLSMQPEPQTLADAIIASVAPFMSRITARSVVGVAMRRAADGQSRAAAAELTPRLVDEIVRGIAIYLHDPLKLSQCRRALTDLAAGRRGAQTQQLELEVRREEDIVVARAAVRDLARAIGFGHTDQIKLATAVSEVARNIICYAKTGVIRAEPLRGPRPGLRILADDHGPGIPNLDEILAGAYQSRTGMGLGLLGCRQLMDRFRVITSPEAGTHIAMEKYT